MLTVSGLQGRPLLPAELSVAAVDGDGAVGVVRGGAECVEATS